MVQPGQHGWPQQPAHGPPGQAPSQQHIPPAGPPGTPPLTNGTPPSTGPPGPPVHCETMGAPQTSPAGGGTTEGMGAVSPALGAVLSEGPTGMGWPGKSCDLARTT